MSEQYEGMIEVRDKGGVLWDVTHGKLVASDDPVEPFTGELVVEPSSGIAGWSGPVFLVIRDVGQSTAILTPGPETDQGRVIDVTGTGTPPWLDQT